MALFLVLATQQSAPLLDDSIQKRFAGNFYKVDDDKWFISTDLVTSKEISDAIGITADPPLADDVTGIVVALKGYYGRERSDLWEWIVAKSTSKVNA